MNSCAQNDPQLRLGLGDQGLEQHSYAVVGSLVPCPHKFLGQGKEVGAVLLPCSSLPDTFFGDVPSSSPVLYALKDMH